MPSEYKIFYVINHSHDDEDTMIEKMNYLITTKLNDGWKCIGGVSFVVSEGFITKICQAMTS
jgi:hypothetical protein